MPHRFQQVINRAGLESLNRKLVVSGDDHDRGHVRAVLEPAHDVKPSHGGHLQVEQHEIRGVLGDEIERAEAVVRFARDFDVADRPQFLAQNPAGNGLVVDDENLQRHARGGRLADGGMHIEQDLRRPRVSQWSGARESKNRLP